MLLDNFPVKRNRVMCLGKINPIEYNYLYVFVFYYIENFKDFLQIKYIHVYYYIQAHKHFLEKYVREINVWPRI